MTIRLFIQRETQTSAEEVSLASSSSNINLMAGEKSRLALQTQAGDITSMTRVGSSLVINTADNKVIHVKDFFGPVSQDMSTLTIVDVTTGQKTYILGDEKLYADGAEVTAYTQEELKEIVSGVTYYEERLSDADAAVAANTDDDGMSIGLMTALGLGGAALIGGAIAIADHNSSSSGSSYSGPISPPPLAAPTSESLAVFPSNGKTISGITDEKAGVTVYIDVDGDGKHDYTATTDANGKWSLDLNPALPDGQDVTAWVKNAAGNNVDVSVKVDAVPPAFDDITVNAANDATGRAVTEGSITGKTEPGAIVKIDIDGDGKNVYTTKADADGNYRIDLPAGVALVPDTSVLSLTDAAGNTSSVIIPEAPASVPIGIGDANGEISVTATTDNPSPTIHGLGTPDSILNIMSEGKVVGTATVGSDGRWSTTLKDLPVGTHSFQLMSSKPGILPDPSSGAKAPMINFNSGNHELNVVNNQDLLRPVESNKDLDAPLSLMKALPDGGYLIAYPEQEAPGSSYYNIKIKIFDASGNQVNEISVGKEGAVDGYSSYKGMANISNFDVAVDPKTGAITIFYGSGKQGQLSYTGLDAVYQRFSADGKELTDGPQVVRAANDIGGLEGLMDHLVGKTISGVVVKALDFVWEPLSAILSPFASMINVDLPALKTLFVDGLSNRIAGLLFGFGSVGCRMIQMDDGSIVFVGAKHAQLFDPETLIDRLDIKGFINDFLKDIGLIGRDNIVSKALEFLINGWQGLVADPINQIINSLLKWSDLDFFEAGNSLYSLQYKVDPDTGQLVKDTNIDYLQSTGIGSYFNESGYLSSHSSVLDKIANWLFGKDAKGDSLGLDGVQLVKDSSLYAVVWQSTNKSEGLNNLLGSKIQLKLGIIDFKTGKMIGQPISIDTVKGDHGVAPKIVVLADGSFIVTWVGVNNNDGGDIYMQRYVRDNDGKFVPAYNQPLKVNLETEGTQGLLEGTLKEAYSVTALANGGYVVTWTSTAADGTQKLMAQIFDLSGQRVGAEFQIDSGSQNHHIGDSSIVALKDGGFAVSWAEKEGSENGQGDLYHSVYNGDGTLRASGYAPGAKESPVWGGSEDRVEGVPGENNVIDARGNKVVDAGAGDDRILVNSETIESVDGGKGFDTVVVANGGGILNTDFLSKLSGIEAIDLNSTSSNTLNLEYSDLVKLNDSKQLFINGNSGDTVDIARQEDHPDPGHWNAVAVGNRGGVKYHLYIYDQDDTAQLWIQDGINVI